MGLLRCTAGRAPVYIAPQDTAELETELLFGQFFCPLRILSGFVEGEVVALTGEDDDLKSKGFVREKDLAAIVQPATHKITSLQAPIFSKEDIKSQIKGRLPFGARISVIEQAKNFVKIGRLQYIHARHVAPMDDYAEDFVAIAERHIGLPYIWGGMSSDGLDCSGLVQSALWAVGQSCPRNSAAQEDHLGGVIDKHAPLQRGDLVFWPGHVGIMQDAERLIHANAYHMRTESELLTTAAQRIEKSAGPIRSIKRL